MWYTALMMGLAGSFHCLGMCSPLVIASTRGGGQVLARRFYYNIGRIFVYALQGGIISSVGLLFDLAGLQRWVSLLMGAGLVAAGVLGMTSMQIPVLSRVLSRLTIFLKSAFSKFLSRRTVSSTIILGGLNGVLPCGLTYIALAYCVTLPEPAQGFLFMTLFGIGTLPVMFGASGVMQWMINRFRFNSSLITMVTIILIGSMLFTRGVLADRHQHDKDVTICR